MTTMTQAAEPIFTLPSYTNVVVTIRYPYKSHMDTTAQTSIIETKKETHGLLTAMFSNGDTQEIDLHAEIIYPLLVASPAEHNFGTIHVDRSVAIPIYLANPTVVDADWKLVHVPAITQHRFIDDPAVFNFNISGGRIEGPTLQLDAAGVHPPQGGLINRKKDLTELKVDFSPQNSAHYRSRFRFTVKGGESFDILLTGEGTVYENADKIE